MKIEAGYRNGSSWLFTVCWSWFTELVVSTESLSRLKDLVVGRLLNVKADLPKY